MIWSVLVVVAMLGYVGARLGYSVRSARARRRGDREHADELSAQGSRLFIGLTFTLTAALLVLAVVVISRS